MSYSFSSAPKPVAATRKKYRNPNDADTTIYVDPKETSITWDKRVHRGNTYSMYTQRAIKEALDEQEKPPVPAPRRKRRSKEKSPFDMGLPEKERVAIDLSDNLVAKQPPVEFGTTEAQTDEFLPEPPPEQYQPQKSGMDVSTQVEDGDLFDFDYEVEPILDVLINKTLEQSIMEVEEENELKEMAEFKLEWYKRQEAGMADWDAQVAEEWVRWREKEEVMKNKREEKRREAQVLLKIQAMAAAKTHLSRVVPNAVRDLAEVAFPDMKGMAINRVFLPQLLQQVHQEVRNKIMAEDIIQKTMVGSIEEKMGARRGAFEAHAEMSRDMNRRRHEEAQTRRGTIRIYIDDGAGGKVGVGPIRIPREDNIEEAQDRVFEWLQTNDPKIASAFQWGVFLNVSGEPIIETAQMFEAKAGQISMVPKPEPPPPEPEHYEEDVAEGEEEGAGETLAEG